MTPSAAPLRPGPDRSPDPGLAPPPWLRFLALAAAAGVLCFGAVGLLLAINGWYRPALAFPLGTIAFVVVLAIARPAFAARGPVAKRAHVYAAVGVAAILAITAWNGAHASQHVLLNRDGGSYTNTGRWIARDGSLVVKAHVGPFANEPSIAFEAPAVYEMPNGDLQFQFMHLLPAVLAESYSIAGDRGLFHAPELLGGIALLAFFVLAWRVLRKPFFALTAMLTLAFIIPQVWYSRDSYSEIPSQILLFTAIWLVVSSRVLPRWRLALTSGLFLGALEAVRVDAIVFLIGVPVVLAVAWLRAAGAPDRREVTKSVLAFAGGLVPGLMLGLVDAVRHSGRYYHDLKHDVNLLVLAAIVSAAVCGAVVASWPKLSGVLERLPWRRLATAAGVAVALVGLLAWFVRPHVQIVRGQAVPLVGGLQGAAHLTVDPTRTYFERSFEWMSWYLGPLTLAVAIVAAGLLVREVLSGRASRVLGALVVLGPGSALYLYKANAVSDHVWVTRRFLVSAFPVLVLLAIGLAAALAGRGADRRVRSATRVAAMVFAAAAVAYPLYTDVHIRSMSEYRGFVDVVHEACDDMGDHAAVIMLETKPSDPFIGTVSQSLRGWCGAQVAYTLGPANVDRLQQIARAWDAQGRRLFVAARTPDVLRGLFPNAGVLTTREVVNVHGLESTLVRRPSKYSREAFSMSLVAVPFG